MQSPFPPPQTGESFSLSLKSKPTVLAQQMDQDRSTNHNHNVRSPKRLTKQSPHDSANASSMSQSLVSQLRRNPSASQSSGSVTSSRDHHRTQSSHASSNSIHESSPTIAQSKYRPQSQSEEYAGRHRLSARQSWNEKNSDDQSGASNNLANGLSSFDSSKASGYPNSLRRPGPPPLSHTAPDPRMMSPSLRQSASFSIGDRTNDTTPPLPDSGLSTPKRYSDEAKNAAPWKKKGSFSSFMNSVLGSPQNFKISNPKNPVHVTHVGFDNETGQFTVSMKPFFAASLETKVALCVAFPVALGLLSILPCA